MTAEDLTKLRKELDARRDAYFMTFRGPLAEAALKDLADFCRANQTTFHVDPRAHALMEGRREVWLRIQDHITLSPDDLWTKYSGYAAAQED